MNVKTTDKLEMYHFGFFTDFAKLQGNLLYSRNHLNSRGLQNKFQNQDFPSELKGIPQFSHQNGRVFTSTQGCLYHFFFWWFAYLMVADIMMLTSLTFSSSSVVGSSSGATTRTTFGVFLTIGLCKGEVRVRFVFFWKTTQNQSHTLNKVHTFEWAGGKFVFLIGVSSGRVPRW